MNNARNNLDAMIINLQEGSTGSLQSAVVSI